MPEISEVCVMLPIMLALIVAQTHDRSVVEELQRIEQRLAATWQAGDCSGWGALLHSGWSVIHITGETITKERALSMCRAARTAPVLLTVDDLTVRVFGESAVVTGRTTARTGDSASAIVTLRFTDVFVLSAGRWQVVASQATQLPSTTGR
jgi:hypothetical protein